eukprot:s737_g9.t1
MTCWAAAAPLLLVLVAAGDGDPETLQAGHGAGDILSSTSSNIRRPCYAGGVRQNRTRVCTEKAGEMGYAEVTQLQLPRRPSSDGSLLSPSETRYFRGLVRSFLSTFKGPAGARQRPGEEVEKGGRYRSCLGLPGGKASGLFTVVEAENSDFLMDLRQGSGGDPDVSNVLWIYDSDKFPFVQAEQYLQFHAGPRGSNASWYVGCLRKAFLETGLIPPTGCPEEFPKEGLLAF